MPKSLKFALVVMGILFVGIPFLIFLFGMFFINSVKAQSTLKNKVAALRTAMGFGKTEKGGTNLTASQLQAKLDARYNEIKLYELLVDKTIWNGVENMFFPKGTKFYFPTIRKGSPMGVDNLSKDQSTLTQADFNHVDLFDESKFIDIVYVEFKNKTYPFKLQDCKLLSLDETKDYDTTIMLSSADSVSKRIKLGDIYLLSFKQGFECNVRVWHDDYYTTDKKVFTEIDKIEGVISFNPPKIRFATDNYLLDFPTNKELFEVINLRVGSETYEIPCDKIKLITVREVAI